MTQLRLVAPILALVLFVATIHCSSDDESGGSRLDSGNDASTEGFITTEAVASLWDAYKSPTATCVDAVKVAIGESGKTTGIPGSSQKACTGACIDPNAENLSGAMGIWQVKCPDPSYTGIYNAFMEAGLIVNGACVDLTGQQSNALAASLVVEVACPNKDFCSSQWTGGSAYYDEFSDAAAAACSASAD